MLIALTLEASTTHYNEQIVEQNLRAKHITAPLVDAILEGNVNAVREHLKDFPDDINCGVNCSLFNSKYVASPLMIAAQFGQCKVMNVLYDLGATHKPFGDYQSVLTYLASLENPTQWIKVLEGAKFLIEQKNAQPTTTDVAYAAINGNLDLLKLYKENGAPIDKCENYTLSWSPLEYALLYEKIDVAKYLLSEGAQVDYTKMIDESPPKMAKFLRKHQENLWREEYNTADFFDAIIAGDVNKVNQRLKRFPSNISKHNPKLNGMYSPLMFAAEYGQTQVIDALFTFGATCEAFDNFPSALYYLASCQNPKYPEKLLEGAKYLIEQKGAKPSMFELAMAAHYGNLEVLKLYQANGAPIDIGDNEVTTDPLPLVEAVASGNLEVVRHLVESGANINRANSSGTTPLRNAQLPEHTEIVDFLKTKGAL